MNIIWKGAKAFTKGRQGTSIKRICIHWVGQGDLETANAWFNRQGANTSAHYGIENKRVYQWVKDEDTAWAVGNWDGNCESISIEHSATPDRPATEETYKTSAELIKSLCNKYNLPVNTDTIKPHKFYSATSCPGTMNIEKIIKLIQGEDMTKLEQLEQDINELEDTLNEKRAKIKELEKEKDKFEDLAKEANIAIKGLIGEKQLLTDKNLELETSLSKYKIDMSKLAQELVDLSKTSEMYRTDLKSALETIVELQKAQEEVEVVQLKDFGTRNLIKEVFRRIFRK